MATKNFEEHDWLLIKEYPMKFEPRKFTEAHWVRSLCEFEHIPMTLEFLLVNGAVLDEDCGEEKDYYFKDLFDFNSLNFTYFVKENKFQFSIANEADGNECSVYKNCKYVDEFQHALRLCGYNDFANNLVLNKNNLN